MAILDTKQLKKVYRQGAADVNALVDVTLSVEAGEFVAGIAPRQQDEDNDADQANDQERED